MKVKFTESVVGGHFMFRKGNVIEAKQCPQGQLKPWLDRGVVVAVEESEEQAVAVEESEEQAVEQPPSKATADDYQRPTLPYRKHKKKRR